MVLKAKCVSELQNTARQRSLAFLLLSAPVLLWFTSSLKTSSFPVCSVFRSNFDPDDLGELVLSQEKMCTGENEVPS